MSPYSTTTLTSTSSGTTASTTVTIALRPRGFHTQVEMIGEAHLRGQHAIAVQVIAVAAPPSGSDARRGWGAAANAVAGDVSTVAAPAA